MADAVKWYCRKAIEEVSKGEGRRAKERALRDAG
jgi:hypothetical protein